jgi:hypothetical protein
MIDQSAAGLSGQSIVYACWRARLQGRNLVLRADINPPDLKAELAHVSILAREEAGFRFRLAGTALRQAFGREARGALVEDISACAGVLAWGEAVRRSLARIEPIRGRTVRPDGRVHFWMRLPMSSDGVAADLVLCHDRILSADALTDPDRAARAADRSLRLDAELIAA